MLGILVVRDYDKLKGIEQEGATCDQWAIFGTRGPIIFRLWIITFDLNLAREPLNKVSMWPGDENSCPYLAFNVT